jgi:GTP cyclohydrolase I
MIFHLDENPAGENGYVALNGHHHAQSAVPVEQQTAEIKCMAPKVDYERLLTLGHELLIALGENPDREGLQDTPRRWADWWREFIEYEPGTTDTTFSSSSTNQLVCVSGMRVFSLCEHHLLPMWCDISIGYVPMEKVLGLSKFARIAHQFAHQLQIQERLGQQIADAIVEITGSATVAVLMKGEHLCMSARGIRTPGTMQTSLWQGNFLHNTALRQEFLQLGRGD